MSFDSTRVYDWNDDDDFDDDGEQFRQIGQLKPFPFVLSVSFNQKESMINAARMSPDRQSVSQTVEPPVD